MRYDWRDVFVHTLAGILAALLVAVPVYIYKHHADAGYPFWVYAGLFVVYYLLVAIPAYYFVGWLDQLCFGPIYQRGLPKRVVLASRPRVPAPARAAAVPQVRSTAGAAGGAANAALEYPAAASTDYPPTPEQEPIVFNPASGLPTIVGWGSLDVGGNNWGTTDHQYWEQPVDTSWVDDQIPG